MHTIRQKIIDLLVNSELDARELSKKVGIKEKEVYEHLSHIARSLSAKGGKLKIRPCECLQCGFVFKERKRYSRPSRCPLCKQSQLTTPVYYIN
jgi:predicted Zn-ribbon and HTH transcriptional regulator